MSPSPSGLQKLHDTVSALKAAFTDYGALGNFAENHDQPRWLLLNKDPVSYQNGLAAAFLLPGIPIAYYGTENAFFFVLFYSKPS